MAAVVADTVAVNLVANTQQYDRNVARSEANFTAAMGRMQTAAAVAGAGIIGIGGAFAALAGSRAYRELSDAATMLNNALRVAGLSGKEMVDVQRQLYESATRNAAPIEAMAQLFQRAALSSKQLGVTTGEITQFIDKVGAALRVSGRSAGEARGALIQLSQAIGAGVVRAEEFNSIAEGAPVILQAVAAGLKEANGDFAQLRRLVVEGRVSSQAFFRAFEAGSHIIEDRSSGMSLTIDQSFTQVRNSLTYAIGKFNEATGMSDALAATMQTLAESIFSVGDAIESGDSNWIKLYNWLGDIWQRAKDASDQIDIMLGNTPRFSTGRVGGFATLGQGTQAPTTGWGARIERNPVSLADFASPNAAKKGRESPYNREIRQLQESIRERELDLKLIGQSEVARDRERAVLEIENAARQQGITLTAQQRTNVLALADSYAQAAQRVREAEEVQKGWIALQEEFGNAAINAIDGLITGTKTLNDVLADTLRTLAKMALQAAILGQGPLAGLMGTSGVGSASGIGGFVGALFGGFRAAGGPVNSGRSYVVGENGPEMFVPGRNGMIVPNDALSGGKPQAGGSIILNNDFRDSSAPAIAALNAKIDRLERSLPMIIQQTQQRQRLNQPFYGG